MVRLREIPRTATFAWCPGTNKPLIVTGTRAGAVDADFSDETKLEIWDLKLDSAQQGTELEPVASIDTDSRFFDIAWGQPSEEHPRGIIAGALENGSLDLWDADGLLNGRSDALMSRTTKHSGAIKALQFNPFKPELLATAGAKGELFITDLNNADNPFRLGNTAARADDFESVDWNKKVPHILVTGSAGGFVTVWDVKAKKSSLTLNNSGRKPVSAVAWDPEKSTRLMTAIPDDTYPRILIWDLRNSNAPEGTLEAHDQGVLSLSWCQQDSDLLLSCGKDNRTICWNPQTGQVLGEFSTVTNWTFQTRWSPTNPNFLATASFDGKIAIQTIQSTRKVGSQTGSDQHAALDGEDFFNSAQSQPQGSAFSLSKPPKWLERPVGASFGFGGKVVSFSPLDSSSTPQTRKSKIQLSSFAIDSEVGAAAESFESAVEQGNFADICEKRISEAQSDDEKADWKIIESLISLDSRAKIIDYLDLPVSTKEVADGLSKLGIDEDKVTELPKISDDTGVNGQPAPRNKRLSAFFDSADAEVFLSGLSATKGAKTDNPFQIFRASDSGSDKAITTAVLLGQFERALDLCLEEDRMSDAFMIAISGGPKCIEKAKSAYFAKKEKGPSYLRLLSSVLDKNLWDIVYNADLSSWKEIMAALCTFATEDEFSDLCEALGDRLEDSLKQEQGLPVLRKDASFCFLAGSKLEKVANIWIEQLHDFQASPVYQETVDSTFSLHAQSLQRLIEKVTVFRQVTKFQDKETNLQSGWKLAALYDKYIEYADIIAAHGQLALAKRYLDLLPPKYAAADVARNRVKQASRKAVPQVAARTSQKAPTTVAGGFQQGVPSIQGPQTGAVPSAYAPQVPVQQNNPYAPQQGGPGAPQSNFQGQPGYGVPPQQHFGAYGQPQAGVGPPPRNINASPSVPPPSRSVNMSNWNDVPQVSKPPTSRRSTPLAGPPQAGAYGPGQGGAGPPPTQGSSYGAQQRATPPLPPPPKGSAPRTGSPHTGPPQSFPPPERPPSAAANAYAPPPSQQQNNMNVPPNVPRGPSPYNPPPQGAPASNRYAPSQPPQGQQGPQMSPQGQSQPGQFSTPFAGQQGLPQGQAGGAPPQNPYAPGNLFQQQGQAGQGAPQPGLNGRGAPRGPPQGPPPGARPGSGQSQSPNAGPPPPPPKPKYPPGDRTHIQNDALPIYDILNSEVQRVKSRAPPNFKAQVTNMEKRVNILFDHLNNDDLLKPDTVQSMVEVADSIRSKNYENAEAIRLDLHTNRTDQCGQWVVGVKALIAMGRATPDTL